MMHHIAAAPTGLPLFTHLSSTSCVARRLDKGHLHREDACHLLSQSVVRLPLLVVKKENKRRLSLEIARLDHATSLAASPA